LVLLRDQLRAVQRQSQHEREIRHARTLVEALEDRDQQVLGALQIEGLPAAATEALHRALAEDRSRRSGLSKEPLLLDSPDELAPHLDHLISVVLPSQEGQAKKLLAEINALDEHVARVESDLDRVPAADRIAAIQNDLNLARAAHTEKLAELQLLKVKRDHLAKRRADLEVRVDRIGADQFDQVVARDDRDRILKHSAKVRGTLEIFRNQIVKRHTSNMETLMLESFQKLLRKAELVKALSINPGTFEVTLTGRDGKDLPFDRLSAGERQLLATSMLWGLARASGRPIPTIIDTPLGRLDSEHRKHLIDRYFPSASHQVLLLSTDEEIASDYLESLRPAITRTYMLDHDESKGSTTIKEGYFA